MQENASTTVDGRLMGIGCLAVLRGGHPTPSWWLSLIVPRSPYCPSSRPGTTIISDEWRAYHDIGIIPGGYTHQTVNHSQNFVDPITGAHTQAIEGHWSCTKRMMRKQGVMNTSSDLFPSYMVECLWRRRYGDSDLFEKLLEHITDKYPL